MKKRNSNIEILRLICMFIIILHHLVLYSNIDLIKNYSVNSYFYNLFMIGGKLGANCFFAISSYFLISKFSKIIEIKKIIKTHNVMLFYSITFLLIGFVFKIKRITLIDILEGILPLPYNAYWFISSYILLIIFSPLLNIVIENMNKKDYKKIVAMILAILSIDAFLPKTNLLMDGQHFLTTIFIYLIVGYISKFKDNKLDNRKLKMSLTINLLFIILTSFTMLFLGHNLNINPLIKYSTYLMSGESIFMIVSSISLFYIFLNFKNKEYKIINLISSMTLDIYLIHMNHIIYLYIWNEIFIISNIYENGLFPVYALLICVIIFIICLFIGMMRQSIFKLINIFYKNIIKKNELQVKKEGN